MKCKRDSYAGEIEGAGGAETIAVTNVPSRGAAHRQTAGHCGNFATKQVELFCF